MEFPKNILFVQKSHLRMSVNCKIEIRSQNFYEDLNLKEIGKVLRVTESRVSQLHAQAVTRLRAKLTQVLGSGELEVA